MRNVQYVLALFPRMETLIRRSGGADGASGVRRMAAAAAGGCRARSGRGGRRESVLARARNTELSSGPDDDVESLLVTPISSSSSKFNSLHRLPVIQYVTIMLVVG